MEHKRDLMFHLRKDQDMIMMIMIVMMMMMMITIMIVMITMIVMFMMMMLMIVMMYGVETSFLTFASCIPAMLL